MSHFSYGPRDLADAIGPLLALLETWSASHRYFQERGVRAANEIATELGRTWGDPATRRELRCPLFLRAERMLGDRRQDR